MDFRDPGLLGVGVVGAGMAFLPGPGLLGPVLWFGRPKVAMVLGMAVVIFGLVYFGTLRFWLVLTGDKLQKPLPEILALFLSIRLGVDAARLFMWQ